MRAGVSLAPIAQRAGEAPVRVTRGVGTTLTARLDGGMPTDLPAPNTGRVSWLPRRELVPPPSDSPSTATRRQATPRTSRCPRLSRTARLRVPVFPHQAISGSMPRDTSNCQSHPGTPTLHRPQGQSATRHTLASRRRGRFRPRTPGAIVTNGPAQRKGANRGRPPRSRSTRPAGPRTPRPMTHPA